MNEKENMTLKLKKIYNLNINLMVYIKKEREM